LAAGALLTALLVGCLLLAKAFAADPPTPTVRPLSEVVVFVCGALDGAIVTTSDGKLHALRPEDAGAIKTLVQTLPPDSIGVLHFDEGCAPKKYT
jgi:hypothetical protein